MKKLLALVLALVMTLGLATVGANAALSDFTDAAEISSDYEEAFSVMNAVGVFQGSDGKLTPTDKLTRAQAAKLIAYLDLGGDIAETLPAVQVFADVPATHWASKYVAYCYNAGIIQGAEANKFYPEGELTGYAFGAYLLAVLGYDRNIEGITGADWQIKAASLMGTAGIASDIKKAGSAVLTREEGAQYCLDALQATMVKYDDKGTTVTTGDTSVQIGAKAATPRLDNNNINYNAATDGAVPYGQRNTLQLTEKLYPKLTLNTAATDAFGRSADKWTFKGSDVITSLNDSAVATFTAKTTAANVAAALKEYTVYNNTRALRQYVTNIDQGNVAGNVFMASAAAGNLSVDDGTATAVSATANNETVAKTFADLTGNGRLVEVYANSSKQITSVVIVDYSVAKITSVSKNTNGDVSFSLTGIGTKTNYADSTKDDTISYKTAPAKDDIVTVAKSATSSVYYIYPTTSVEGTQTAYTTGASAKITVDGTAYTVGTAVTDTINGGAVGGTGLGLGNSMATAFPNSTKAAAYYFDQYGFVVARGDVTTETNYAFVSAIAGISKVGVSTKDSVEATLVFPDASTQTVKVASINGATIANGYLSLGGPTFGSLTPATADAVQVHTTAGTNDATFKQIVTYTVNSDGNYELTYKATSVANYRMGGTGFGSTSATIGNVLTSKGVPTIGNATDGGTVSADNKTVYVVRTYKTGTTTEQFATYTGFANVPSIKATGTIYADWAKDADGNVVFVYIDAAANGNVGETTKNVFYRTSATVTTVGTGSSKYYTMDGFLNGEGTTIQSKADDFKVVSGAAPARYGFYDLTVDGNGYVTAAAAKTFNLADNKTVTSSILSNMTKGTFDGKLYSNSATTVYVIDGSEITKADSLESSGIGVGDSYYADRVGTDSATDAITMKTMYIIKDASYTLDNSGNGVTVANIASALASTDEVSVVGDFNTDAALDIPSGKTVKITGDATLDENLTGTGTLIVEGTATICNTIAAAATVTIDGDLSVITDPVFNAPVTVKGNATINANTAFMQGATIEGNLNVTGTAIVSVPASKTLTVKGIVTAASGTNIGCANNSFSSSYGAAGSKLVAGSLADANTVAAIKTETIELTGTTTIGESITFDATNVDALTIKGKLETAGATSTIDLTGVTTTIEDGASLVCGGALTIPDAEDCIKGAGSLKAHDIATDVSVKHISVPTITLAELDSGDAALRKEVTSLTVDDLKLTGALTRESTPSGTLTLTVKKLNVTNPHTTISNIQTTQTNLVFTDTNTIEGHDVEFNDGLTSIAFNANFTTTTSGGIDIGANDATLANGVTLTAIGKLTVDDNYTVTGGTKVVAASLNDATKDLAKLAVPSIEVTTLDASNETDVALNAATTALKIGTLTLTTGKLTTTNSSAKLEVATIADAATLNKIAVPSVTITSSKTDYAGAIDLDSAVTALTLKNDFGTSATNNVDFNNTVVVVDGAYTLTVNGQLTIGASGSVTAADASGKVVAKTLANTTTAGKIRTSELDLTAANKTSVVDAIIPSTDATAGVKKLDLAANTDTDALSVYTAGVTLKWWSTAGNTTTLATVTTNVIDASQYVKSAVYDAKAKTGVYWEDPQSNPVAAIGTTGFVWVYNTTHTP